MMRERKEEKDGGLQGVEEGQLAAKLSSSSGHAPLHPLAPTTRIRASSRAPQFLMPALLQVVQPMQDVRDDDGRDGLPKAAPSSSRLDRIRLANLFWGAVQRDCARSRSAHAANGVRTPSIRPEERGCPSPRSSLSRRWAPGRDDRMLHTLPSVEERTLERRRPAAYPRHGLVAAAGRTSSTRLSRAAARPSRPRLSLHARVRQAQCPPPPASRADD